MKFSLRLIGWAVMLSSLQASVAGCSSAGEKNEGSENAQTAPAKDSTISKGVVVPKVICRADTSVSYALYLPKSYTRFENFPVIFLFDSHGNGLLPVEKYKTLADKYNYILAGSNTSKNGMSWEQNQPQIRTFMNDVRERFNINGKRIYACGFSGGSRVASSVAIFDGGINCVIGMGAGLPSLTEPIRNRFDYIGFAGNEDFNMNEMIGLTASMDKSPIRHQLIIFNGKHEWAPDSIAEDAFVWCELNAMKDGLIPKNDSLISGFRKMTDERSVLFQKENKVNDEFLLCRRAANFLGGLIADSLYKTRADELLNSEKMKKVLAKSQSISNSEAKLQQSYKDNFALKDLAWWKHEIYIMNYEIRLGGETGLMFKRLRGYLSLLAYMNSISALEQNQYPLAENYLKIYEMVDPANSEHQYLLAKLYAIKNDAANSLLCLSNVKKIDGTILQSRIETDTVFKNIINDPQYKTLIASSQKKL